MIKNIRIILIAIVCIVVFIYPVLPFLYMLFTTNVLGAIAVVHNPVYCFEHFCVKNQYTATPLTLDEAESYIEQQLHCDIENITAGSSSDEAPYAWQHFSFIVPQYDGMEVKVSVSSYTNDKTTLGAFHSTEDVLRMGYTARDLRVEFFEKKFKELGYDRFIIPADNPDFLKAAKDVKAAYETTKQHISENYGEEFMQQLFDYGKVGMNIGFTCGDITFGAYCAEDVSPEVMSGSINHWYYNRLKQIINN